VITIMALMNSILVLNIELFNDKAGDTYIDIVLKSVNTQKTLFDMFLLMSGIFLNFH
jgi:hypothetical protein